MLVYDSSVDCPVGNGKTKFTLTAVCDKSITGQGQAKINSVDYTSDPCNLQVEMSHEAACPTANLDANIFVNLIDA